MTAPESVASEDREIGLSRREAGWVLRRCSRKGHVVAHLDDATVDSLLRIPGETSLLRCLRCGTYVAQGDPAIRVVVGSDTEPAPLEAVPQAVRGAHGRKLGLLRLLAAERAGRGFLMIIGGLAAFQIINQRGIILDWFRRILSASRPLDEELGAHILDSTFIARIQTELAGSGSSIKLAGIFLLAYGILQIVEGFGLWGGWRWAEYLAVIATSCFIPLEVYELIHKPTALKWMALAVNIAAVVYLVWKGRLFGIRGGHHAYLEEVRESTLLAALLRGQGRSGAELTSAVIV